MYITKNETQYPCTGYKGGIDIRLTLPDKPTLTGTVMLCADDGFVLREINCADYARQVWSGETLTLTNEPEPQPHIPTLDEMRKAAMERISGKCSAAIYSGVTVEDKHYRLNQNDQLNLNAALSLANSGIEQIPFAASGSALTMYSSAAIKSIGTAAYEWGLANQLYYAALQTWIGRETDMVVLGTINYGSALPDDLTTVLTQTLTAAGIDAAVMSRLRR